MAKKMHSIVTFLSAKNLAFLGGALVLLLIAFFSAEFFLNQQENKALHGWKRQLNRTAEDHSQKINTWLISQKQIISNMAYNKTTQRYFAQLQSHPPAPQSQLTFQQEYLENLLINTAYKKGFISTQGIERATMESATGGLALLNRRKELVITTPAFPNIQGQLKSFLAGDKKAVVDSILYEGKDQSVMVAMLHPIYHIDKAEISENLIGYALGIKTAQNDLFTLLDQSASPYDTTQALLLRAEEDVARFIIPPHPRLAPFAITTPLTDTKAAASKAIKTQGHFGIGTNQAKESILFTSKALSEVNALLLYSIHYKEAMQGFAMVKMAVYTVFTMTALLLMAATIAIVFYMHQQRYGPSSSHYKKIAQRFKEKHDLLHVIADNKPGQMYILDEDFRLCFANKAMCETLASSEPFMIGKKIEEIYGRTRALTTMRLTETALKKGKSIHETTRYGFGDKEHIIQLTHTPIQGIPGQDKEKPGVLVIEQDITSSIAKHEALNQTLHALVDTLVSLMDQRDHYATNHSGHVGELAGTIAREMGLDETAIDTAIFAGKLMNLGKIMVSRSLLTKVTSFTKDEKRQVNQSIQASADLLQGIAFKGPVIDTIRQSFEYVDGTGPLKLKKSEILLTARIVAVANSFVAMISPRAHREALPMQHALVKLQEAAGSQYDHVVVSALVCYLDDDEGQQVWEPLAA